MDFENMKNIIKLVDDTLEEKNKFIDYLMKESKEHLQRAYAAEDRVAELEEKIAELEKKIKESEDDF